ncbi:MAG TPA: protease pro-enzyme activation domain-containing protein, partial [Solirubrobacteraceae bacterium]
MFRRSAGSLVVALLSLLAAATAASAARAPRIWFPMNRLPLAHATRLGTAPSSQRMEVGVGLKDPHPAAEQKLMAAQQSPASPQYHHFLTPARYDQRFAVSKTAFQHTLSWLRAGGATIVDTSGARDFVEISAPISELDKLFQTTIGSYEAQGVHFLANESAPSVPAGLHILTVMGLNTLIHPTTPLSGATTADRSPGSSLLGRATDPSALKGIAGQGSLVSLITSTLGVAGILGKTAAGAPTIPAALTPQQLWGVYDMPSGNTGQGQSVAVMGSGDSSTTVKDLALFEQEMKLPQVPVKVTDIPKEGDFSDTGGNVEWELDTQASTGMAPNVKQVHLYFAQHLIDPDAEADFAKWVDDKNGPKQANASFGECETTPANATLESTIPA